MHSGYIMDAVCISTLWKNAWMEWKAQEKKIFWKSNPILFVSWCLVSYTTSFFFCGSPSPKIRLWYHISKNKKIFLEPSYLIFFLGRYPAVLYILCGITTELSGDGQKYARDIIKSILKCLPTLVVKWLCASKYFFLSSKVKKLF